MKQCFKCGLNKPTSDFYKHPRMGDGLLGKCKDCTKSDSAKLREIKLLDPVWVSKERSRCRIKTARKRALNPDYCKPSAEVRLRWQKRNKNKRRAHCSANRAVLKGTLVNPGYCEDCKKTGVRLHKHHHDYTKPLDVVWLCPKCHGIRHRKPDETFSNN